MGGPEQHRPGRGSEGGMGWDGLAGRGEDMRRRVGVGVRVPVRMGVGGMGQHDFGVVGMGSRAKTLDGAFGVAYFLSSQLPFVS